jgi:hypothetical protein
MADAKPIKIGKSSKKVKPRNTARDVRAGLIQKQNSDGTPLSHPHDLDALDGATGHHHGDEGTPGTKGAARNKHRAEHRRENKFAGGEDTEESAG